MFRYSTVKPRHGISSWNNWLLEWTMSVGRNYVVVVREIIVTNCWCWVTWLKNSDRVADLSILCLRSNLLFYSINLYSLVELYCLYLIFSTTANTVTTSITLGFTVLILCGNWNWCAYMLDYVWCIAWMTDW